MLEFNGLTKDTAELAYSGIAFMAGQRAAQLALSDIMKEQKAAREATLDAANEHLASNDSDPRNEDPDFDVAADRKATFEEWCALLACANDELLTLANGGKWPRVQDVSNIMTFMQSQSVQAVQSDDIAEFRALLEAHTGKPAALTDKEIATLAHDDNVSKAEFFASQYLEHGDDIADRIKDQMANTSAGLSFHTALNNLPERAKLQVVNMVIRKIDTKCDELLTGKRRGPNGPGTGAASPVAKIPRLARAAIVTLLRNDQAQVKTIAARMEHAA